MMDEFK
jgi:IQ domain-containing protein H